MIIYDSISETMLQIKWLQEFSYNDDMAIQQKNWEEQLKINPEVGDSIR